MARPIVGGETGESEGRLQPGRVVYIHPEERFFTLEFTANSGATWRESFWSAPAGRIAHKDEDKWPKHPQMVGTTRRNQRKKDALYYY